MTIGGRNVDRKEFISEAVFSGNRILMKIPNMN